MKTDNNGNGWVIFVAAAQISAPRLLKHMWNPDRIADSSKYFVVKQTY